VKDIQPGIVRQAAIDVYPNAGNATRIRQFITPTQAVINHAAELELRPPIKVSRKKLKIEKKIKDPFTLEWVETFRKHASPHLGALTLFTFATGARISEALRVEWDDMDLKARTVVFRKTKISEGRIANLPMPLVVALANLPKIPNRPVFKYRKRAHCAGQWDTAVKRAGLKRLTFHSLRHGFATSTLRSGIDPKTGAWLGGWKSIRHFMETYAHAIQDITLNNNIFDTPVTQNQTEVRKRPVKRAYLELCCFPGEGRGFWATASLHLSRLRERSARKRRVRGSLPTYSPIVETPSPRPLPQAGEGAQLPSRMQGHLFLSLWCRFVACQAK
jgi:hypothetical protein